MENLLFDIMRRTERRRHTDMKLLTDMRLQTDMRHTWLTQTDRYEKDMTDKQKKYALYCKL